MAVRGESRKADLYGATIPLTVVANLVVIGRLFARRASAASLWWDDYLIGIALVPNWGISICYWIQNIGGLDRHTIAANGPIGPEQLTKFFKLHYAIEILYSFSAVSIKTSLLLLYYRLFGVVRWFRWLLIAVWLVVAVSFIVCLLVLILECSPIAFYWDKSIENGSCINQKQFNIWGGVINLLIDFVTWSVTLPMIWRLRLSRRQKWSLSTVFLLGLLACAASITRVVAFKQVDHQDITYTEVPASVWTVIEQYVGIICACLPALRAFLSRSFAFLKYGSKHGSRSDQTARSHAIPLPRYGSKHTPRALTDTSSIGFTLLNEDNRDQIGSVTAQASKAESTHSPILEPGIFKKQRIEQEVEDRPWLRPTV